MPRVACTAAWNVDTGAAYLGAAILLAVQLPGKAGARLAAQLLCAGRSALVLKERKATTGISNGGACAANRGLRRGIGLFLVLTSEAVVVAALVVVVGAFVVVAFVVVVVGVFVSSVDVVWRECR